MPLPAGVEIVTVSSGEPLVLPDGTWIKGRLLFTGPDLATIAEDDVTLGGTAEAKLVDGEFSVRLVATDATGMSPTGGTYKVTSAFTNAPNWVRYISLPKAVASVKLADVLVPDPVTGEYSTLVDASTIAGAFLAKSQNLADLPDKAEARTNLDLGDAAVLDVGTVDGTVAAGDDPRFSSSKPWVFDVTADAYGAVGDARVVADGAMLSGSTTLTSATLALTSNDIGKRVSVKGAGPTGVTTLIAVINQVNSPTSATLSAANASGGNVTNAVVIVGTDDTAEIQAAIDAAEAYLAAGHTYAQVYFPPRPYVIAGPLNTSKSGNGQLVFGVYAMTGVKKHLEFASDVTGAAAVRTWLQGVPQYGGACLISFGVFASTAAQITSINAAGNPGVISGPTEGFGYGVAANFSNVIPVLRNISFLTVHSSFGLTYGAANLWGCANAEVRNFSTSTAGLVTGNDYSSPGTFGTGLSVALMLPAPGNNDLVIADNVSIGGGYTYAMFLTEHGLVSRYMALYCWAGLVAVGSYAGSVGSVHAMKVLSASIEACINEVYILGVGSGGVGPILHMDELSTESSTPNVGGQAAHMAAARGWINWAGLFTENGLTHDNPTGIVSSNGQTGSEVRTVTGTVTARPIDRVLKADASGAGVTVNLPSAAPNLVTYRIIKSDATGNTVTVDPFGSQTINGAATRILSTQWETVTLRSDGSNWIAI
ncbi:MULTISPECIES: hypothetical protein [unclassified Streptomyces]|uniref:hypothetical protein n=1 Tax=unclassified Streptomyces TaxID=2593676 RepID=UPI0036E97F29